jgi:hypothetical protein
MRMGDSLDMSTEEALVELVLFVIPALLLVLIHDLPRAR